MTAQQFPKQPHSVKILWYGSRSRLPTEVTITPAPCACAPSSSNAESTSPLAASRWLTGSSSRMEIEGLAQTADECDALLLPERELPGRSIPLVGNPRSFEQALDPVRVSKSG